MTDTEVDTTTTLPSLPAVVNYDPKLPAVFGNNLMLGLIAQVAFEDELAKAQGANEEVKKHIGFELTRALMDLNEQHEDLNLYSIWDGGKSVEKLNNRILIHLGVMERKMVNDGDNEPAVKTIWTDKKVEEQYAYGLIDKEKDEKEYTRRFNNRKRLNLRLSDAAKAAIALIDNGNVANDLSIVETEGGSTAPVIKNAPKALAGENKDNKPTTLGVKGVATGATHSASLSSLVAIATKKHKVEEGTTQGETRSDEGNDRSDDAKMTISDEDFGAAVNNIKAIINAQEGEFSDEQLKQVVSLRNFLNEQFPDEAPTPDAVSKTSTKKPAKK